MNDFWLPQYAKAKKTEHSVLVEVLKHYRFEVKRREFEEGFVKASNDAEMMDWAEAGIEDYNGQLKAFD